jgi:CRP-like cAMP-binding protein
MSEQTALTGLASSVDDIAALLSGVELFEGLALGDLTAIASLLKRVELAPGEVLWRQGTPHDGLYFLLEGEAQVCRQLPGQRELELARLGSGEVMGEIPLLSGGNHSATVRALGPCTLLSLRRAEFEAHALVGDPAALELRRRIVAIVCARLRDTYAALAAAGEDTVSRSAPQHEPLPAVAPPRSYLSRLPLFGDVDPEIVDDVLARGRMISVPRGHLVQREGDRPDACYVVLNGAVEDVLDANAAAPRVGFAGPGHAFGVVGLLDGEHAPVSSVACERSLLLEIGRQDFGVLAHAFITAIESDLIRSLEVASRALSHLQATPNHDGRQ